MKTIGKVLWEARKKKKISISRLSEKTKIKAEFLRGIEKENWHIFPNFAVTRGFVRNFATVVGVDLQTAEALLRRDFQAEKETPKITTPRIIWTPKITIVTFSTIVVVLLSIYIIHQYLTYAAPPPLSLESPKKNGNMVEISGSTRRDAQVLINNEPVLVADDGSFHIELSAKTGEILKIEALSRAGKATKKEIIVP